LYWNNYPLWVLIVRNFFDSSSISICKYALSQINLAELLPTAEGGENIINPWERVLLNVQDWIDGLLEITTQSNIAILYHWNNRGCQFTPINFGQASGLWSQSIWYLSCFTELWLAVFFQVQLCFGSLL
jgi:hypothetical protein